VTALHQIIVGATAGDAITDHALAIRRWLRARGRESDIYAVHIHPSVAREVRPLDRFRPGRREKLVIFHHSVGDPAVARIAALDLSLILVYHNITPSHYFTGIDPAWAGRADLGRRQLTALAPKTRLAVAVSAYNAHDLRQAGFETVAIVPLPLESERYSLPSDPVLAATLGAAPGPLLLFVGRLAPNKRQEDLVKLLYFVRRRTPDARLALVGDPWEVGYGNYLSDMARVAGLESALLLPGKVSQQELVTYYREADLFVSMSEHEGFGLPLIESMLLGLPVMAYAAGAVPATVGDAGILFRHKHYPALAELAHLILTDDAWRQALTARGSRRAAEFLEPQVRAAWERHLAPYLP
jgi:glycosyltransferase involved in cell wall biosynthesis